MLDYAPHFIGEFTTSIAFAVASRITQHHKALIFVWPTGTDQETVYVFGIFLPILWLKK